MMWAWLRRYQSVAWQEFALFWRWWIGQLHDIAALLLALVVPRLKLRTLLTLERTGVQVAVLHGGQFKPLFSLRKEREAPWPLDLRPFGSVEVIQRTRTAVALSKEFALTRELILPEATERELDRVVPLYLEREFPLTLSAISFTHEIARRLRATRQIVVRVIIVRRDDLDAVLATVRSWELVPIQIGMTDETSNVRGNFMKPPSRRTGRRWEMLDRRLFASCLLCGFAAILIIVMQWGYERNKVGVVLRQAQVSAVTVKNGSAHVDLTARPAERLAKITRTTDAADILTTLTERTPADTWIYQLTIDANPDAEPTLSLSVVTSATLQYLKTLDDAPEFDHVSLVSVMPDSDSAGMKKAKLAARWSAADEATADSELVQP